jgi:hypothetical protein
MFKSSRLAAKSIKWMKKPYRAVRRLAGGEFSKLSSYVKVIRFVQVRKVGTATDESPSMRYVPSAIYSLYP